MFKPFLVKFGFKSGQLFLNVLDLINIRVLFRQFTTKRQLFLIDVILKAVCSTEKIFSCIFKIIYLFVCQSGIPLIKFYVLIF